MYNHPFLKQFSEARHYKVLLVFESSRGLILEAHKAELCDFKYVVRGFARPVSSISLFGQFALRTIRLNIHFLPQRLILMKCLAIP
jgi:hypothetical protein